MREKTFVGDRGRRAFLGNLTAYGGALLLGGYGASFAPVSVAAAPADEWSKQIGIQLNVIRDQMSRDPDATIATIAGIGYKAFAPVGFSGMDPKQYRTLLDNHGIVAPNIDLGFSTGSDMEKDLAGCQVLGCRFAEPGLAGGRGGRAGGPAGGAAGAGSGTRGGRGATPPATEDSVKQTASDYNRYGAAAKNFGIKVIFHNHVEHFELLEGSRTTLFDLFLTETDPDLVAMELDIANTAIAGRNIPEAIKKYPGRFPIWDFGDAFGIKMADASPDLTPNQRRLYTYPVPVGLGDVDFKSLLSSAQLAGLQYAMVSQTNASTWGDSLAAARISYQNLIKMLP